jgi:hypothetical protein
MRHQKYREMGKELSQHLAGSERSIDTGLIAQASLVSAMLKARLELGFAACFQSDLIRDAGEAFAHGLAGRERMLDIHARLAQVSSKLGIDPVSFGDAGDKEGNAIVQAPASLAVVPAVAERRAA